MSNSYFGFGQSKVNCWRRCKQEYHYKYVEELRKKTTKRPFMFGKIIHRMIEAKAEGDDPFKVLKDIQLKDKKLFDEEREMYGEIIEDIKIIMVSYFDYWTRKDAGATLIHKRAQSLKFIPVESGDDDLRYTEHEFEIEVRPGLFWKGQVDGLAATSDKLVWLVENKSFDKLPNDEARWRNIQTVSYAIAVTTMGWAKKVDGVCWNYIKSKAPTEPLLLKSGKQLSIKDIVTLPSVVRASINKHGLSLDGHQELLDRAKAQESEYFQRLFTPLNPTLSKNIFDGFIESALKMRDTHGKDQEKNLGRHCDWCDYSSICRAELTGGDTDFVKEKEFIKENPEAYRRNARDAAGATHTQPRSGKTPKLYNIREKRNG